MLENSFQTKGKPPHPCAFTGCAGLAQAGKRFCPSHSKLEAKRSTTRFYSTPEWKAFRTQFMRLNTRCICCGQPATVADHITPINKGGAPLDERNLQPLCSRCHAVKSSTERTGFKSRAERFPWMK